GARPHRARDRPAARAASGRAVRVAWGGSMLYTRGRFPTPQPPRKSMNPVTTRIAPVALQSLPPYAPTTYVDFTRSEHRTAFEQALAEARTEFGKEHLNVIGGKQLQGDGTFETHNPARPSEVIGRFQRGTRDQAELAVE